MDDKKVIIHHDGETTDLFNVIEPIISEEINGPYTFSFTTVADAVGKLVKFPNKLEIEGQFFNVAQLSKRRSGSEVNHGVTCKHISYELEFDEHKKYVEELEGTPLSIMTMLLADTGFEVGQVDFLNDIYMKVSVDDSVRAILIKVAKQIGGELKWDNRIVSILYRRGGNNNLEFELGENLRGVTANYDSEKGYTTAAYEVEVLDLAHLPQYADLAKASLGDDVTVSDWQLDIDVGYRVVKYEYDPFQKVTPSIAIGWIIPDYTDYTKDLEERVEELEAKKEKNVVLMRGSGWLSVGGRVVSEFDKYWTEFGTIDFAEEMIFDFKNEDGYTEVDVVTGKRGAEGYDSFITLICDDIKNGDKIVGVKINARWDATLPIPDGLRVSINAVCKVDDEEVDVDG